MNNIYMEYPGIIFEYWYPIQWENRDPEYLNVVNDREPYQDYMFPPKYEEDKWQEK